MRSSLAVRILVVVGGVLAALGLVAGHFNRQLLDGPTFAANVDEVRRDGDVAALLGREISNGLIRDNPDLVAIRPLVEAVAVQVAGGDLLSRPTRAAASVAHQALIGGDSDAAALRITDAAAVVAGVLNAIAPERAAAATDVPVTLAAPGTGSVAEASVAIAGVLDVLAWVLPVLAVACFAAAIWLSRSRWATMAAVGWALTSAAAALGAVLAAGGFLVRRRDDDVLAGAFARAAWSAFVRPLWWGVVVLAVVGLATVLACGSAAPEAIARYATRAQHALVTPRHPAGVVARALVAAAIGVAAIVDPIGLLEPVIVLGGVGAVLWAMVAVARVAVAARDLHATVAPAQRGRRPGRFVAIAVAGLVVVAGVVVLARPGGDVESVVEAGPGDGTVCNGHAELCDRRFDEVAYPTAHNAMAVANEPGWFIAEQVDPIPVQLDQGVRALQLDVWSGIPAGTVVRTAPGSHDEALAIAEEELGPEVVEAALRLADSIAGEPTGAEARFLCHGVCETGSTPLLDMLSQLRGWIAVNPDEVVTLFIEDHVDADLIAADIEAAGLVPFVHTPVAGEPWPTLGEMIRAGRRLVVMLEEGRGGTDAPWLVNGFDFTMETPYTWPTVESFNCDPNRGTDDGPLFQLNHWLSGFTSLVSNAQLVNQRDVLLARAEQCADERGQIPNFVAVNFVAIGDLFDVVDELNGVA